MPSLKEALIRENISVIGQGSELLARLDDETCAATCRELGTHRSGGHLRHCLEFYQGLLDGIETLSIGYDARKRDHRIESGRRHALASIERLIDRRLLQRVFNPLGQHVDEALRKKSV